MCRSRHDDDGSKKPAEGGFSAVIGRESVHGLGYLYDIIPAAVGASIMLAVAPVVNNVPKTRRYPEFLL